MLMNVRQLIEMLKKTNQEAPVFLERCYNEGKKTEVSGMIYHQDEVTLSDEELS